MVVEHEATGDLPWGRRHVVAPAVVVSMGPVAALADAVGVGVGWLRSDRLPASSTSLWTRPERPDPGVVPLALHFEVKAALGFDHAVVVGHRTTVRRASRVGDRIGHHQELRSVGPVRPTSLGPGRSWSIDHVLTDHTGAILQVETFTAVGYDPSGAGGTSRRGAVSPRRRGEGPIRWTRSTITRAAAAARVWAPVHHDPAAARRAGLPDVIACTQHLAMVFEHAALDASGTHGRRALRVATVDLRIRRPVVAGMSPQTAVVGDGRLVEVSIATLDGPAADAGVRTT